MVDSECLKIVIMQDGAFSDFHKAGVPLALGMHLTEKGLHLREVVWTARQLIGFSISFYWEQTGKMEWERKGRRERGWWSL